LHTLPFQIQMSLSLLIFSFFCLAAYSIYRLNLDKEMRHQQHEFLLPTLFFILALSLSYGQLIHHGLQIAEAPETYPFLRFLPIPIAFTPYLAFIPFKALYLHPNKKIARPFASLIPYLIIAFSLFFLLRNYYQTIPSLQESAALLSGITLGLIGIAWLLIAFLIQRQPKPKIEQELGETEVATSMLTKKIELQKAEEKEKRKPITEQIRNYFYQKDEKLDNYYLYHRYGQIQNVLLDPLDNRFLSPFLDFCYWLFKPYRLLIILFGLHLSVRLVFGEPSQNSFTMFSFVTILAIGELYGFISGEIKDIASEEENLATNPSKKQSDFDGFHKNLAQTFENHYLMTNETTGDEEEKQLPDKEAFLELLREEPNGPAIANYFQNIRDLDLGYAEMTKKVFYGESLLVHNPFYWDLNAYVVLPLLKQLINGNHILAIGGRASQDEDLVKWLKDMVRKMMGTEYFFETDFLELHPSGKPQIGILRNGDVNHFSLLDNNQEFLEKVELILLIEPSRLVTSNQISLNIIANKCSPSRIVLAMDRPLDGLVDNLSHTLNVRIKTVSAMQVQEPKCYTVLYDGSCSRKSHQAIFPHISRYLGGGTEFFAVAQRHHMGEVIWASDKKFPIVDMKWIAGQYYKSIAKFAQKPHSQALIEKNLKIDTALWNIPKKENNALVVEDEFHNLIDIRDVFMTRAKNICNIQVISDNYMMRDYMLANMEIFRVDKKAVPTMLNDFVYSERNLLFKIIMQLCANDLKESQISYELETVHIESANVVQVLEDWAKKFLAGGNKLRFERFIKEEINYDHYMLEQVSYIHLRDLSDAQEVSRKFISSYLIVEDLQHGVDKIGSILYDQVYQTMLPTQFLTYSGKYYQVDFVNQDFNVLLKRSSEYISQRTCYRQIRNYTISDLDSAYKSPHNRTFGTMKITVESVKLEVQTIGYYQQNDYGNIATAINVQLDNIPNRSYLHKNVLRLEIPESTSAMRTLLAVLLSELFKSTMPQIHDYIAVATPNSEDCKPLQAVSYGLSTNLEDDCGIYIMEDSEIDLGIISSVSRNLIRFFEIITDYLMWYLSEQVAINKNKDVDDATITNTSEDAKGRTDNDELLGQDAIEPDETENQEPHDPNSVELDDIESQDPPIQNPVELGEAESQDPPIQNPVELGEAESQDPPIHDGDESGDTENKESQIQDSVEVDDTKNKELQVQNAIVLDEAEIEESATSEIEAEQSSTHFPTQMTVSENEAEPKKKPFSNYLLFGFPEEKYGPQIQETMQELSKILATYQFDQNNLYSARNNSHK